MGNYRGDFTCHLGSNIESHFIRTVLGGYFYLGCLCRVLLSCRPPFSSSWLATFSFVFVFSPQTECCPLNLYPSFPPELLTDSLSDFIIQDAAGRRPCAQHQDGWAKRQSPCSDGVTAWWRATGRANSDLVTRKLWRNRFLPFWFWYEFYYPVSGDVKIVMFIRR